MMSLAELETEGSLIFMNSSTVTEFIFLGISCSHPIRLLLFILTLVCYTATMFGNLLIMVTVNTEPRLHQSPMYFFLAALSTIDAALGCVAAPKVMADLVTCAGAISFGGCMAQFFFLHFLGGSEMMLLTLMAYDRYVAICQPLTYMVTMNRPRCVRLLASCWVGGFLHSATQLVLILRLPFCGPNELDSFFCDVPQLVRLACANAFVTEVLMVANSGLLSLISFLILLVSYGVIIGTLKGHFKERGGKALSTCSSHLMVVSLIFVPCLFVYLVPFSSSRVDKTASIFYTVVTPALNPIIYTLRNRDMKEAMGRLKKKCIFPSFFSEERTKQGCCPDEPK